MRKLLFLFIVTAGIFVLWGVNSTVRAEAATGLNQNPYCSGTDSRVFFSWDDGPNDRNPHTVWLDTRGASTRSWDVTGSLSADRGSFEDGGNYEWRINQGWWIQEESRWDWYPTSWRSFTAATCKKNDVYIDFCENNSGTNWEVAYKMRYADGSWSGYWRITTLPGSPNDSACTASGYADGVLASHPNMPVSRNNAQILWWTQCIDPYTDPNVLGSSFINFFDNVTYPGGNNLGTVLATDSTGNSCPVGTGGGLTPASGLSASASCASSTTANVNFNWTPASGGTFDQQWHDYTVWPTTSGDQNGQALSVGQSSTTRTMPHNTTIYWRINTHSTNGNWYPSAVASVNTPNCTPAQQPPLGPTGLGATQSCSGGFPSVNFSWNPSSGADGYWVDVTVDGFGSFSNRNTTSTSVNWSQASPFGGGSAVTQTPQNNRTYQWRVYAYNAAGGNHSGTAGILTNDCTGGQGPTVDLKANGSDGPITVSSGTNVTLSWTTGNSPTSCTASGGWSGSKSTTGGSQVVTVTSSGSYSITCSNTSGSASDSVTVNVSGGAPTVDIKANGSDGPITVSSGTIVGISWSTGNSPTSCTASGAWSGAKSTTGGSENIAVSANSTFTITCTNVSGSAADSVTVNIGAAPPCDGNAVGNNQLIGCLWDGTNFNTADGAAPAGAILSAPVPNTATALDIDWADGAPNSQVGADTFSGRWRGNFTFNAGTYTFYLRHDDGARLNIDGGTNEIDAWGTCCVEDQYTVTFSSQAVHSIVVEHFENGGAANIRLRWTFTPVIPPPSNLTVSTSCVNLQPQITFNWQDNSTNETGFYLDVNAAAWTGPGTPSPWGNEILAVNQTSFVWSQSNSLDTGTPTVPGQATTYWWRMAAFNAGGQSAHVYPPNSTLVPGVSFTTPDCRIDPDFDDVLSELQFYTDGTYSTARTNLTYAPNETIYVQVRLRNSGGSNITTPFWVGFYLEPSASPVCGQAPSTQKQILSLGAGAVDTWQFTIAAPSTQGVKIAYAFADYQCGLAESNENNNIKSKAYNVDVNAWVETSAGDVGSHGQITAQQAPPNSPQKYNSTYLLAGSSLDTEVTTQNWRLNNYNRRLVPTGGTYNYLAERFRSKATGANVCSLPATLPSGDNFYQCTGDATFSAGSGPGGNNVFFIDGNLIINGNLTLGASDTATFIVRGNIDVANAVSRIDGIYIAGGTFTSGSGQGQQLLVGGAVYANSVVLGRTLASSGCGVSPCDNLINPAERIVYDPKYIIGLNSLLGNPAFAWREVAP